MLTIFWSEELLSTVSDHKERALIRSKTFPGIAQAMADQWGGINELKKAI